MARRKRRIGLRFKLIVLFIALVYIGVLFFSQQSVLLAQEQTQKELDEQYEEMQHEVERLEHELEYIHSDEYIEKTARERLGWVKENEIKFMEEE